MSILPQIPQIPEEPEGDDLSVSPAAPLRLVQPAPRTAPERHRPGRPGVTTVLPIAGALAVAGLLGWAAFANTGPSATRAWEAVPAAQPFAEQPPTPKIPAGAKVTAASLPPIVSTAVRANVTLRLDPGPLGGTYGSDAQVHDDVSPALFSVPAGRQVTVRVLNYDDVGHSFTSPALGLNVWVRPGGDTPSVTTFHFKAPAAGNYLWVCGVPCDPWSMATPGYMQGEIHVA